MTTTNADLDEDGAPVSSHPAGDALPGDVRAWERLGVGHRCETWLAWSYELWAPVVVKFPRPHQLDHPRARGSLQRESSALAGNLHPALPRLYVDGTGADVPFVVVEYVDGVALDDAIDEDGPVPADQAALLGLQLLAAVHAVHTRGIVHVDIKPANVVVRDGRPVLLDFGSARRAGATQPSGKLIGSPGYAAPELEAGAPIAPAMDGYGIGVTLHEALTGEITFDPGLAASERPAPAPLPGPLGALVGRLLAVDADERTSVPEAWEECAAIAAAAGHTVRPPWDG